MQKEEDMRNVQLNYNDVAVNLQIPSEATFGGLIEYIKQNYQQMNDQFKGDNSNSKYIPIQSNDTITLHLDSDANQAVDKELKFRRWKPKKTIVVFIKVKKAQGMKISNSGSKGQIKEYSNSDFDPLSSGSSIGGSQREKIKLSKGNQYSVQTQNNRLYNFRYDQFNSFRDLVEKIRRQENRPPNAKFMFIMPEKNDQQLVIKEDDNIGQKLKQQGIRTLRMYVIYDAGC